MNNELFKKDNEKGISEKSLDFFEIIDKGLVEALKKCVIERAKRRIERYNSETDRILFEEEIYQVREMTIYMLKHKDEYKKTRRLVYDEFNIRFKRIEEIISKTRKDRPSPDLSPGYQVFLNEIEDAAKALFDEPGSLIQFFRFMIESKNEIEASDGH